MNEITRELKGAGDLEFFHQLIDEKMESKAMFVNVLHNYSSLETRK